MNLTPYAGKHTYESYLKACANLNRISGSTINVPKGTPYSQCFQIYTRCDGNNVSLPAMLARGIEEFLMSPGQDCEIAITNLESNVATYRQLEGLYANQLKEYKVSTTELGTLNARLETIRAAIQQFTESIQEAKTKEQETLEVKQHYEAELLRVRETITILDAELSIKDQEIAAKKQQLNALRSIFHKVSQENQTGEQKFKALQISGQRDIQSVEKKSTQLLATGNSQLSNIEVMLQALLSKQGISLPSSCRTSNVTTPEDSETEDKI